MNQSRRKYMYYHSMAHKTIANKKKQRMIINDPKQDMAKGWQCTKCGRINSPLLGTCPCSLINNHTSQYSPTHYVTTGSNACASCTLGWGQSTMTGTDTCMNHFCAKRGY